MEIPIRLVIVNAPQDVAFGIQKGHGANFDPVAGKPGRAGDLVFDFTLTVKDATKPLNFTGPFAQGPADARFVYIDVGTMAGQKDSCWTRRIKVPLKGISKALLKEASDKPGCTLVARIPGTGRDGTPSCATVKLLDDWKISKL